MFMYIGGFPVGGAGYEVAIAAGSVRLTAVAFAFDVVGLGECQIPLSFLLI